MTAEEQLQWATGFGDFLKSDWPQLEPVASGNAVLTLPLQKAMASLLEMLTAWPFSRDFASDGLRYNDFANRAYRLPLYIKMVQDALAKSDSDEIRAIVTEPEKRKPGRPASAATLARREAEAKAAKQQTQLFNNSAVAEGSVISPSARAALDKEITPAADGSKGDADERPSVAAVAAVSNEQSEYKLSISQKRMLLSVDLAKRTEDIRTLRGQMAAAAEKAKTLAELNRPQKEIEVAAKESIEANDAVQAIFAEIDTELAVTWYRLQNDSDEWRNAWLQKHGFKSIKDVHDDLRHDLRKHYEKVKSPEFDLRCRTLIEQESPEYVAKQKAEAEKKKEVQDIIRYFKRKDKAQKMETARAKFRRLEELLGKKEAANYRPLLAKIEGDAKQAEKEKKATVPDGSPSGKEKRNHKEITNYDEQRSY